MNAETVYDTIPKRPVVAYEKSLGKRNPDVVNSQITASELSKVKVEDSLHRAAMLAEAVIKLRLWG